MSVQTERRALTVHDYYRMVETGILSEDEPVELIEGEIVRICPIGSRHAACVRRLNARLATRTSGLAQLGVQDPIRLDDFSEPEPDLTLLRPREDYYASEHPKPPDVLIVVEVADSSLEYDRNTKMPLYAGAGIPEAWLVDLSDGTVSVYTQPRDGRYREIRRAGPGDRVTSAVLPDLTLLVDEILG